MSMFPSFNQKPKVEYLVVVDHEYKVEDWPRDPSRIIEVHAMDTAALMWAVANYEAIFSTPCEECAEEFCETYNCRVRFRCIALIEPYWVRRN